MKRTTGIALAALLLSGCQGLLPRGETPSQPPAPTTPAQPSVVPTPPPPPPAVTPVPQPPKMTSVDWQGSFAPLIDQLLGAQGVEAGSILLVDGVQNKTNGQLSMANASEVLRSALAGNPRFQMVSAAQLAQAKQRLGLAANDSLGSRSKAIGLARQVSAQYVLYTTVSGNVQSPRLAMQLMLVQSGEIIWSGKGPVAL
ncbi:MULTISPECIES: penicillin-binding protein activator LpoB [Edwardsiella]|uniref:Penicillin-binding protein activator LpoB n=1 Tax=Edwardsiella anguillarum TaxID=1821960 RepID=A0ABY8SJG9_9GAMM|nr:MULTISPECIES: penicillin-binding protein activator LpoB [Edwardsiella]AKM48948.1 penicillin-binding protein [Edwardsiella sp. EA181011]UBU95058.1 penicillin-binding protein activator LpoB [Edwardsiella sp. LADL05-105]UOU80905.1 penicillin-binding protein activator LpoB [Edwardsiella anguillarum]WHP82072.1 penicillin-binding protein activator LpoB [Edwardsiella anguillarum]WHP85799.1 penicillin-binding protein activator LpoB [Edwardsiella anguillarum]